MRLAALSGIAVLIYLVLYGMQSAYSREAYTMTAESYIHEFQGLGKSHPLDAPKVAKCVGVCPDYDPYAFHSATYTQEAGWDIRDLEYFTSYNNCMHAARKWILGLEKGALYTLRCEYHD